MKIYSDSSHLPQATAQFIFSKLKHFLREGDTLLVVSGGSVGKEVWPHLGRLLVELDSQRLKALTIGLVDERFGKAFHQDSNMLLVSQTKSYPLLHKAGCRFIFPLTKGASLLETAKDYDRSLDALFKKTNRRVVGVFGVGSDGHTAGIKPQASLQSFQKIFATREKIVGYQAEDFARITLTPFAIARLGAIVIYAFGEDKRGALQKMLHEPKKNIYRCPAIIFQTLVNAHLFTDRYLFPDNRV